MAYSWYFVEAYAKELIEHTPKTFRDQVRNNYKDMYFKIRPFLMNPVICSLVCLFFFFWQTYLCSTYHNPCILKVWIFNIFKFCHKILKYSFLISWDKPEHLMSLIDVIQHNFRQGLFHLLFIKIMMIHYKVALNVVLAKS